MIGTSANGPPSPLVGLDAIVQAAAMIKAEVPETDDATQLSPTTVAADVPTPGGSMPNKKRSAPVGDAEAPAYERIDLAGGGFKRRRIGSKAWNYYCQHNRQRDKCKDCGGSSICDHNRRRSQCKLCGGASVCEHQRIRSTCKLCGGSGICKHKRRRDRCKECGGSAICQHNRQRDKCKNCGGRSICAHNRERNKCKDCKGRTPKSSICIKAPAYSPVYLSSSSLDEDSE